MKPALAMQCLITLGVMGDIFHFSRLRWEGGRIVTERERDFFEGFIAALEGMLHIGLPPPLWGWMKGNDIQVASALIHISHQF